MINELLAPAGNLQAVKVAIDSGADAVYCSGLKFGARSFITNLTDEDIVEAAKYVHLHSKKIYITLNTLIFEDELEEVKSYIDFLYHHVDAIIVQDYGVIHYIRSKYPDFPVHVSTQCSIHNKQDIELLKKLGVSRVVLAREVPLEEIREFNKLGIELEIFIHGALCFSYSGMCYLSYYKGGRSGNRGSCAQPCRQNYELLEDGNVIKEGALLSMKDLNTISNIKPLLGVGVTSLKIEGRAKSLEYVASVVKIYRKLIDEFNQKEKMEVSNDMLEDLYSSFSRETTKGYLFGEDNKDVTTDGSVKHQGIYIGKVIEYKKGQAKIKLNKSLEILDGIRIIDGKRETGSTVTRIIENGKLVKKSNGTVIIDIKDFINPGALVFKTQSARVKRDLKTYKYVSFRDAALEVNIEQNKQTIKIDLGNIVITKEANETLELAKTINKENVIAQFSKTNNLPISYININYKNDDNLFIPIPLINELRRNALDELKDKLENQLERNYLPYPFTFENNYAKKKEMAGIAIKSDRNLHKLINNQQLRDEMLAFHLAEVDSYSMVSPFFGVNNHFSVSFFRNMTKGIIILSFESSLENAKEIYKYDKNVGYLVEFNEPLMIAKHCVVAKACGFDKKQCGMCKKRQYQIRDNDRVYDLRFHNCIMRIEGKKISRKDNKDLVNVYIV
ncbi:MAG: U32 family peptidase [Bacilli bacterium]|nr:U32 family peptidase [Bacilli bacterium]